MIAKLKWGEEGDEDLQLLIAYKQLKESICLLETNSLQAYILAEAAVTTTEKHFVAFKGKFSSSKLFSWHSLLHVLSMDLDLNWQKRSNSLSFSVI